MATAAISTDCADLSDAASKPWLLVTHQRPDTDAWLCLWAADRFIVPEDAPRQLSFVEASTRLSSEREAEAEQVLYMDVGGGDCDQHGKRLVRSSSFKLVVEKYGLNADGSFNELVELACATDNVERIDPTSIHYIIKGLPAYHRENEVIDWTAISNHVFMLFDILHGQAKSRIEAREGLKQFGRCYELRNGLCLGTTWCHPELREAAFESGAHVVMWTNMRGKKGVEFGIQVGRSSKISLRSAMAAIRQAEAAKRGVTITPDEAKSLGTLDALPSWFQHDSYHLILSGCRSHRLTGDEYSRLTPYEVLDILKRELAKA